MRRRAFLAATSGASVAVLAGCLGDTEYTVADTNVQTSPGPLSFSASILDADATIEGPATLEFTLTNTTKEALRIRNYGIWPLGILSLDESLSSNRSPSIKMYSKAYSESNRVEISSDRSSMSVEGRPLTRSLAPSGSVSATYQIYGNDLPGAGKYYLTGSFDQPVLSYTQGTKKWTRYTLRVAIDIRKKKRLPI